MAWVLLAAVLWQSTPARGLDDPPTAKKKYDTFKARVSGGDLTIDWREFRLAAMVAGVNGGFEWQAARNKAFAELDKKDSKSALADAQSIIDHNMANPEGHIVALMAYQTMGEDQKAQAELAIVKAIVKSIDDSGDGKTAATAFFTVDPSEEYFYINVVLGAKPKSQALSQQNGHAFDVMTITDKDGQEQTLWFNTDTDMQIMDREMNPKKK